MAAAPEPDPYQFDPEVVPRLWAVLDDAGSSVDSYFRVAGAVHDAAPTFGFQPDDPAIHEMVSAFWPRLRAPHVGGDTTDPSATLGELSRPIDATLTLWTALAASVTNPVCRARLEDMLFSLHHGNVGDHGRAAVEAYLAASQGDLGRLDEMHSLLRAWTLARLMRSEDLEGRSIAAMKARTVAELETDPSFPGVALPMLRALAAPPRGSSKSDDPDVGELLSRAQRAFPDAHVIAEIAAIVRHHAPGSAAADEATRAEVHALLDEASRTTGHVKMINLDRAAAAARRRGLPELEAEAVAAMQTIAPDDLQWATFRSEVNLPAHVVEDYVRLFDEGHDWRWGVVHFLETEPPTGRYDANLAAAKASVRDTPLRSLIPTVRFGHHRLPQQTISGEQGKLDERVVEFENMHMQINGEILLADGLDRIRDGYGIPDRAELVAFLAGHYGSDVALLESLASALMHYWNGEYDDAVYVATPRIEAGARGALLMLNAPVYEVEMNRTPGQFPGLAALLPRLVDEGFDPDWERFLGTFLTIRGDNFRNLISHGFLHDVRRGRAALAIRAFGLVATIAPPQAGGADERVVRGLIARPVDSPIRYPLALWARVPALAWVRGLLLRRRLRARSHHAGVSPRASAE